MRDISVLVTGIGAEGAYGLIKSLKSNGERNVRIVGVDIDSNIASRYFIDKFYIVPRRTALDFMPAILEIVKNEGIDVVFPIPTAELEIFAEAKEKFELLGKPVVVSRLDSLRIANNKANLYQHLLTTQARCVPRHLLVNDFDSFLSAVHDIGYPRVPVCFKPPVGTGAKGFRILDSKANQLSILLDQLPNSTVTTLEGVTPILEEAIPFPQLIVMEFLPGKEYDVDVLAMDGRASAIIPRRNEKMLWGLSLVSCSEENKEVIDLTKEIIASLRLSYVVSLSFKYSSEGVPKIIEINPRIPGSVIAAVGTGVNMPYLSIKLALGEKVVIPPIRWGTRMIRYWNEVILLPNERPQVIDI